MALIVALLVSMFSHSMALNITLSAGTESCSQYPNEAIDLVDIEGTCYVRYQLGPHNTVSTSSCAYWTYDFPPFNPNDPSPNSGTAIHGRIISGNTVVETFYFEQPVGQVAVGRFRRTADNDITVKTVLVRTVNVGIVLIGCPTKINGVTQSCSIPNEIYVCTYNRTASETVVQDLISAAGIKGMFTYLLASVTQTGCSIP